MVYSRVKNTNIAPSWELSHEPFTLQDSTF